MMPRRADALLAMLALFPVAATDARAQAEWRLVEELRIGGEEEGPASFSSISGLAVAPDGRLFILERSTQDIRIFDASGRHVKTVGRTGSGPGEYRFANGILRAPDGTVWVHDPGNARLAVLGADGALLRHHSMINNGYGAIWGGAFDEAGRLWDPVFLLVEGRPARALRRFSPDLVRADTLEIPGCAEGRRSPEPYEFAGSDNRRIMVGVPFSPGAIGALDPEGAMWCGWNQEYVLVRRRLGSGDTIAVVRGTAGPQPVTASERDSALAAIRARAPGARPDPSRIPDRKPVLVQTTVDPLHRLWVRVADGRPGVRYDVFGPGGAPLATARAEFSPVPWFPPVVDGDRFYTIVYDEDEVPFVVRARIVRAR